MDSELTLKRKKLEELGRIKEETEGYKEDVRKFEAFKTEEEVFSNRTYSFSVEKESRMEKYYGYGEQVVAQAITEKV